MAGKNKKSSKAKGGSNIVAQNRRARFDYFIEDTIEAGLVLTGTEVKSLREGKASINESYAGEKDGEILLFGATIPEYEAAGAHLQHAPRRPRKLLLHKNEIAKLLGAVTRKGVTLIPTKLYFNERGRVKLEIGIATGKKQHDKREATKERDWQRQKSRIMSEKG